MARENSFASPFAAGEKYRWQAEARDAASPMQPTAGVRTIDLRGSFRSGQLLAGTGALVFEGEILEGPRFKIH